jgi:hypothetical protein
VRLGDRVAGRRQRPAAGQLGHRAWR